MTDMKVARSLGTGISQTLFNFLRERALQQHQEEQIALARAQEAREAEAHRAELADRQRQSQRQVQTNQQADADRLARLYGPDADLTSDAAETLQKGGYAVNTRNTLAARTLDMPTSVPGVVGGSPAPKVPGVVMDSRQYSRRGETFGEQTEREQTEREQHEKDAARAFQFHSARVAADERADQAQLNRDAAAERAAADRDTRELIARLAQSGNAETRALANELRRIQIGAEQEKLSTTRTERDRTASSARQSTQAALDSVDKLLKSPGIGVATGAYEVRGFTQPAIDFNAERDQLVALLTLPNLGALKGPMSDKDVIFVKQIATKLANTRMSEAQTRAELNRVRVFLQDKMREGGAAGPAGPAIGTRRTINGVPAVWDGQGWLPERGH